MKEKTKKIVNIIGAMSLVFACVFGVSLTTTNKTPIKTKANNESDIVINDVLQDNVSYLLPSQNIQEMITALDGDEIPYKLTTLSDKDYTPVFYLWRFGHCGDLYSFFNDLIYNDYYVTSEIYFNSGPNDLDELFIQEFDSIQIEDSDDGYVQIFFMYDDEYMGSIYVNKTYELETDIVLAIRVNVNRGIYNAKISSHILKDARVYNVDKWQTLIDTGHIFDINGSAQEYLTYNIYPRVTIPRELKLHEYYLGEHSTYIDISYRYCEYSGEYGGIRYYVDDETPQEIVFTEPNISPNGKDLYYEIDKYNVVYDATNHVYNLNYAIGKDANMITFIPTLENVLFYKYQGFKAYGNNGVYDNNMPNTYFALRNLQTALSGQQRFWVYLYLKYNGVYYDRVYASVYYHDYGHSKMFIMYNDNGKLTIYNEVAEYSNEVNATDYSYETQLNNYVINVIEQPYTQGVYDFIAFYTMGLVDKNTIIINPLTNSTTSTDFIGGSGIFDLFGSAFNGIYSAFNVMVFPGVTLWALLMIPLVGVILLFIVKLFKR